ncbi:MAG: chloride channel protein [Bacteroidia bacterium]
MRNKLNYLIQQLVNLLNEKLSPKQFLMFAAILVGICTSLLALFLKLSVATIHHLFATDALFSPVKEPFMLIFPIIGILLSVVFTQKVLAGKLHRGVAHILYEITKKSAFVQKHKIYSQIITSSFTVGLGGSAGLEAPIVVTGSAVGSVLSSVLKRGYRDRILLLGCGAAAGIASVFNAPVAGIMFASEVLLAEVSVSSFLPLIISAACGALFSQALLQENTLFLFARQSPFDWTNTPYYLLLAFFTAFVSLYYLRVSQKIHQLFAKITLNPYLKALVGGCLLIGLIYLFPTLFGEGYSSIRALANGKADILVQKSLFASWENKKLVLLFFLGGTILIKAIATSLTLSSGGNGGNFAPSLFVGAFSGFFFVRLFKMLGNTNLPESNFTIVGMAGVLAGVMYAPLTGIFLIAEVTGGYELIIPLMIVAGLTSFIVRQFEPISPEFRAMIEKGEAFSENKDHNILILMDIEKLVEHDFHTVPFHANLGEMVEIIKVSKRNIFPVVNQQQQLEGILALDDLRSIMFETKNYEKIKVENLMKIPPATITITESMTEVLDKFQQTKAWNLPVIDATGKYRGFISKSSVLSQYREQLLRISPVSE